MKFNGRKIQNTFDILDCIEELKEEIQELEEFRRELFFLGTPRSEKLETILNKTIKTVILLTEVKMKQLGKLESMWQRSVDNE